MKTTLFGLFGAVCLALLVLAGCDGSPETSGGAGQITTASAPAVPTPTMPSDEEPGNPIIGQVAGELVRLDAILQREAKLQWSPPLGGRSWHDTIRESRERMLGQILLQKAILNAVKREGLEDRVEKEVTQSLAQLGPDKLEESGMTMEQFKAKVARILLQTEAAKAVPEVTEREMKDYYETNKTDKFLTPERLSIRRIQRFPAPGQATGEVHAEMERIRAEILTEFETRKEPKDRADWVSRMARSHHQGPDRDKGGWFVMYRPARTEMTEEFRDIVFNAELYQLSPVYEVDGGFLLFYPDSRYGRVQRTYEESRDLIRQMLIKERQDRFNEDWERGMLEDAGAARYLEKLDQHLPPEPESARPRDAPSEIAPASPMPGVEG